MFTGQSSIFLNSFLHQYAYLDTIVYFLAQILPFILFGVTIVYFLIIKRSIVTFVRLSLVILSSWALSEILKFIFAHPRPFMALSEITPLFSFGSNDSFPSGHATVFSALALATFFEHKKLGFIYIIAALLIGLARAISGVHYVHDILAGFLVGSLLVLISYGYLGILRNKS